MILRILAFLTHYRLAFTWIGWGQFRVTFSTRSAVNGTDMRGYDSRNLTNEPDRSKCSACSCPRRKVRMMTALS